MYNKETNIKGLKRRLGECLYMDPVRHEQHWAWMRKKAQAIYRNEPWELTIEQFFQLWDDSKQWDNRGRHPGSSAMFMIDTDLGWTIDNVEICDRSKRLRQIHTAKARPRDPVIKRKYTKKDPKWFK